MRDPPPHQQLHAGSSGSVSTSSPTITPASNETVPASSSGIADSTDNQASIPSSFPSNRLGMERGYSLSPMYSLILEYNKEQGDNLSMAAEVSWILQKPSLKPEHIEKVGDDSDPYAAVRLVDSELQPILRVVTELQVFLDRMAQLIEERTTIFRVDPRETMTLALQGCASRSQLEVAYKILLKRLLTAQQMIMKYESQYRQLEAPETPLSPLSTVLELYDEFDNIESMDDRMRFMLGNIPRHQNQILPGAREALKDKLGWDVIFPTPPLPSATVSRPPTSEFSRTQIVQGKKKVDWDDSAPWEDTSASVEQGRNLDEGLEPSFGFQTPFKKGTHFFNTSTDTGGMTPAFFSTPGLGSATDITAGLATPSRTELGENVREYGASQRTSAFTMTKPIPDSAQIATSAPTNSSLVKNVNPFTSNGPSGSPHIPSNRGGGNGPPGGGGNGPPHPGGGGGDPGGGPPNQGGGGGPNHNPPPRTPQFYGNPGGGGGGGGGGDPGGGGGPNPQNNDSWPPAPYGNMPASIKTELKVEQLPEWDGNHWTTIDYFWQIQQLAYLGGWLPEALGYWLWFRLKDSSPIRRWFVTLPLAHQSYMRSHYLRFLKGIKDGFLGHRWQLKMNNYYNAQSFRERNHERELPSEFIIRRIIYTRMLLSVDAGGPLEVFYIMRKAPVSWGPILLLSSIKDLSELYSRVTEHEEALLEAYCVSKGGHTPSIDNIVTQLKQMGFVQERQSHQRRANVVEYIPNTDSMPLPSTDDVVSASPTTLDDLSSGQHVLREAYQVLRQRPRLPPKGGYPFSKNDHITTKMGKMPPSPCKCCGSANHWDKECPDWNTYLERAKRSANSVEIWSEDEADKAYMSAYSVLDYRTR